LGKTGSNPWLGSGTGGQGGATGGLINPGVHPPVVDERSALRADFAECKIWVQQSLPQKQCR